jgi:hypothetical protein
MSVPVVMAVDGDVVAVHSYWTGDGSRIVTRATVRTATGEDVVVTQRGGSVGGIAQITMPGPPPLALGMKVAIAAHRGVDLSNNEHVVLDRVKVLAYPPGFVRTGPTERGNYLYWESGCVFITPDSAGTPAIPGDEELAVIDAAIAEWNSKTDSCSYMTMVNEGARPVEVSGKDNINAIKFRDRPCQCMDPASGKMFSSWCLPATEDTPQECHSPFAAGLTTVTYSIEAESDGAIVDADIELNGVNFSITVAPDPFDPGNSVLQNTLTHELGHLLGLAHNCVTLGEPPRVDGNGNDVPACDLADDELREATMWVDQEAAETKKMTLSDDDIAGICQTYPLEADPQTCAPVPGPPEPAGCCTASGSGRSDVGLLLAGMTALIVLRRRKTSPNA